jgi:hypothetical protein
LRQPIGVGYGSKQLVHVRQEDRGFCVQRFHVELFADVDCLVQQDMGSFAITHSVARKQGFGAVTTCPGELWSVAGLSGKLQCFLIVGDGVIQLARCGAYQAQKMVCAHYPKHLPGELFDEYVLIHRETAISFEDRAQRQSYSSRRGHIEVDPENRTGG